MIQSQPVFPQVHKKIICNAATRGFLQSPAICRGPLHPSQCPRSINSQAVQYSLTLQCWLNPPCDNTLQHLGTGRHPASRQGWPGSQYIRSIEYNVNISLFHGEVVGTNAKEQSTSQEERKELLNVRDKR